MERGIEKIMLYVRYPVVHHTPDDRWTQKAAIDTAPGRPAGLGREHAVSHSESCRSTAPPAVRQQSIALLTHKCKQPNVSTGREVDIGRWLPRVR